MVNEIFKRIDDLMRHKGKQNKELLDYLNIDRNSYNNWKNGKSYSFIKYINEISGFLQVSPRFLLIGDVDIDPETNQEIELLDLFRAFSSAQKDIILTFFKTFSMKIVEA